MRVQRSTLGLVLGAVVLLVLGRIFENPGLYPGAIGLAIAAVIMWTLRDRRQG